MPGHPCAPTPPPSHPASHPSTSSSSHSNGSSSGHHNSSSSSSGGGSSVSNHKHSQGGSTESYGRRSDCHNQNGASSVRPMIAVENPLFNPALYGLYSRPATTMIINEDPVEEVIPQQNNAPSFYEMPLQDPIAETAPTEMEPAAFLQTAQVNPPPVIFDLEQQNKNLVENVKELIKDNNWKLSWWKKWGNPRIYGDFPLADGYDKHLARYYKVIPNKVYAMWQQIENAEQGKESFTNARYSIFYKAETAAGLTPATRPQDRQHHYEEIRDLTQINSV